MPSTAVCGSFFVKVHAASSDIPPFFLQLACCPRPSCRWPAAAVRRMSSSQETAAAAIAVGAAK